MQVWQGKELLPKSAQFVRRFCARAVGEGVYPPVVMESARKDKEIKGIYGVPLDDDGDEGSMSD